MTKFIENNYFICKIFLSILFSFYLISMFLYPWFNGGWKHVHAVWYDWQALNVGLLAFASTLILFNISRSQTLKQNQRELIATRAFMPEALSELNEYCKSMVGLMIHIHEAYEAKENENTGLLNSLMAKQVHLPSQPTKYKEIFSKCISLAEGDLAEYLSYILNCFQIQNSRLLGMYEYYNGTSQTIHTTHNSLAGLMRMCELHELINNLYSFARGEEEDFSPKPLTKQSFDRSITALNLFRFGRVIWSSAELRLNEASDNWRLGWPQRW